MKQLILIITLAISINTFAQDEKTVTLVANGQGKTQDEAKQNALRNAIQQAFGTFISSNTNILNDDLVKDEIVSVSNGNIQKFEIISELQIPNGEYATSLKATVSVTKLTSFVESKGVVAEFKGSLFAFNVNQQILNEKNEIKAIEDLCIVLNKISDASFDYSLKAFDPISLNSNNEKWQIPLEIKITTNNSLLLFKEYLFKTLKSISLSDNEASNYINLGKDIYPISLAIDEGKTQYAILRKEKSLSKIISSIYYFNNSILSFKIKNGIQEWNIKSKPDQVKNIDDSKFRIFLRIGNNGSDWHGYNKNSVFYTGGGSYKSRSLILNHDDWYVTKKIWNGNSYENITGLISSDFLLDFNKVVSQYSSDRKFSFVGAFQNNIQNGIAGLVISFIGIESGTDVVNIAIDDIRTLEEINKITKYEISK